MGDVYRAELSSKTPIQQAISPHTRGSYSPEALARLSSVRRLKPYAIDIWVNIDPLHWLLSPAKVTHSSHYREKAALELLAQGLEFDYTIVARDADSRWSGDDWSNHSCRRAKGTSVKKPERRQYLKYAYCVSLTRARQGIEIFVPPGAKRDKTRSLGVAVRDALRATHYATAAANAV